MLCWKGGIGALKSLWSALLEAVNQAAKGGAALGGE